MYGLKVMSESLQKMAGSKLSNVLGTMTTNRFTGVLTGAFITAAVQSSTATSVMTVSFVSAGILSLAQAISVIMGAHIGTTFTAWIMVLGGGSFDLRLIIYTMIVLAVALIYTKKNATLGDFLIGLSLLLLGLTTLKINATEMHLDQMAPVRNFFVATSSWGYGSYFLYLVIGAILTFSVQSSAAIMAITMTLCSSHVLPIDMGIALILGENLGTTITANVVALSASIMARRAALAHFVSNFFGVIWVLCVLRPFVGLICRVWGVEFTPGIPSDVSPDKLNAILATFHTGFNVTNTFLLIWFIPLIEKLVTALLPSKPEQKEKDSQLQFISGGLMSTSELSILQAWKEVHLFAVRAQRMIGMVHDLFYEEDNQQFTKIFSRIEKYEGICDRMEYEIAQYLNQVADGRLSDSSKREVHKMLRIVSELESVGDANYNLSRYIKHKHEGNIAYTDVQDKNVEQMIYLVSGAQTMMVEALERVNINQDEFFEMTNMENEINNYRDELKNQNMQAITDHVYEYSVGVNYMDVILELEKMADYIINVDEALYEHKHDK
ncbi:MAG: Na/Pi cotransporter family protein [Paludibacteraceae bacterium]|nr:Na/Pi cotransporter family protein [Paludibacteraceae bacterium]MBR1877439.1 Na/Pi cotransporter family protein [Paludibacteraceae bacterium]